MYKNQNEVDKIQEQIREIDSSLSIRSCAINGQNEVTFVEVEIPVKGNKRTIEELKKLGWKNAFREKRLTDHSSYVRCQYSGYVLVQRMLLKL